MGDDIPAGWKDDSGGKGGKGGKDKDEDDFIIPGEQGVRRKHKVSKEQVQKEKDEYVTMNWDEIFPKKPYERLRWLDKALKAAKENRVKPLNVFDVIVHRKFLDGLKGAIATDCLNLIRGEIDVFSAKQKKQLQSDNFDLFRKYAPLNVLDSDDDEASAPPLPPPPKVIIQEKTKKRKNKGSANAQVRPGEESDEGNSEDDTETKKLKILAKGTERRVDPADGQAYSLAEFVAEYGGSIDAPPDKWHLQRHTAFIYKE